MAGRGPKLIVAGAAVLSVIGALEVLRDHAREEVSTEGLSIQVASTTPPGNSVAQGEAPRAIHQPTAAVQERPAMATHAIPSVGPVAPMPREVEALKTNNPVFAPAIEISEAQLGSESQDPSWSPAMETRILTEISNKALGVEIGNLQVDCRTTICRVQMVFPEQLLEKPFGVVPEETSWDGHQPVGFFIQSA